MWEAIAANRRRSSMLLILMFLLLVLLGAGIGFYVDPQVAPLGALVACGVWLVLLLVSLTAGDALLLSSVGARKVEGEDELRLLSNVVEEMSIAAGLPKQPDIYVMEDDALNAFAVGRSPEKAAVAVTSGLLRRLNRDELQGVVAHEIGHVANLDIRFMTQAGVMLGAIALLSDGFMRSLRHGTPRRSRSSKDGGGQAIVLLLVLVLAILAPILAQVLYYACSRQREYLADASAARYTRFPAGLASALEKIAGGDARIAASNRATAPMFIINPLQSMAADGLFATHPPIEKRIAVLRGMGGAGYGEYLQAYEAAGAGGRLLAEQTMRADAPLALRAAGAQPPPIPEEVTQRARAVNNLLATQGGYRIIDCPCGMQLKVPPEWKRPAALCPRCNRAHVVG